MDQVWEDGDRRQRMGHARTRKRRKRRKRRREEAGTLGEPGYRDAAELAERKLAFIRDAITFGFWTTLALVFIFPLGVIMLIFGAPKRIRRFSKLYFEPRARDRLTQAELRKRSGPSPSRTPESPPVPPLAGASPASRSVAYDRAALEELERSERVVSRELRDRVRLRLEELHTADVIESALESLRDRITRGGVSVERRFDGEGVLVGDAEKLTQVLALVVARALDAFSESETRDPRIDVDMGQNLAGSAVWIRVRDNGPELERSDLALAERWIDAHGGQFERAADPAGGVEVLITLPRQPGAKGE